ncbi:MAG TPA: ABC transporter substrate-binding protein, partial [Pusillimonas sp.]|nr:ABC transporter substrate-binding protein [Pusillimonas sp.]
MKRNLKAVLAVSLAAMAFQAHADDKIKLGFIAALSGPLGVLGAEQQRGLDLALEHLNNRLGNREVELYTADSRAIPGVAVQEVSKLVDKEDVDVITGGTASNEIMAMV